MARYSIVKRHRYYYKYDTAPNATVVGNFARIDKGVARGFTTANYLTYPEIFNISTADSWEMECKFTFYNILRICISSVFQRYITTNI